MSSNVSVAHRQDSELPTFASREAAEHEMFARRDEALRWLTEFARARGIELPLEPRSLETLEDLYFQLWGGGLASRFRGNRTEFEFAMGMFWGAVAVTDRGAAWTVYESPFVVGHYGVAVAKGNSSVVLNALGIRLDRKPGNKRHRRLRELYDQIIGRA